MDYTCPRCGEEHSQYNWNDKTKERYGGSIIPIEKEDADCFYVCPSCSEGSDYTEIEKGYTIRISKKEYKELLEIKAMYEGLCK